MAQDSRIPVGQSVFSGPYSAIALINTIYDGEANFRPGTGFYVGNGAVLTAWHVISENDAPADGIVVTSGGANLPIVASVSLEDPNNQIPLEPSDQLLKVATSEDIGLVLQPAGGFDFMREISGAAAREVFGIDAYVDYENFLAYQASINAKVQAKTAGFPQVHYEHDFLTGTFTAALMHEAQGEITEVEEYDGHHYVSDVPFLVGPDGLDPQTGVDGTLDASVGQSGSPLWTVDEEGAHRAMGVTVQASGTSGILATIQRFLAIDTFDYQTTLFEVISADDFTAITNAMSQAGITQPETVTNRVTGTYGNTQTELIVGSDYRDVLRGLGAGETGADTLVGSFGNDVYEFTYGFGVARIWEPEAYGDDASQDEEDTIHFKGIDPADVRMTRNRGDSDLYIYVRDPQTNEESYIRVDDQFYSTGAIEFLRFDTGQIDLRNGLLLTDEGGDVSSRLAGLDGNDILLGLAGKDTLRGSDGDDTLVGGPGNDALHGGLGDDFYEYSEGDGFDIIHEEDGFDTLILTDLNAEDIRLERKSGINYNYMYLYVHDGSSDIPGQGLYLGNYNSSAIDRIERLVFADGSDIDLTGGLYFRGTDGWDANSGTQFDDVMEMLGGPDSTRALGGNDTIIDGPGNDSMDGGFGADTYIFRPGHGGDLIWEIGGYSSTDIGPIDTIVLDGMLPVSVRIVKEFSGDLVIYTSPDDENYIYVPRQYWNYNPGNSALVERIVYGNGATVDLTNPSFDTNAAPDVFGETANGGLGQVLDFQVSDLLHNDADQDMGTDLKIVDVLNAVGGTAAIIDEVIQFTPGMSQTSTAQFDYLVSDGIAAMPATVTIRLQSDLAASNTITGTSGSDLLRGGAGQDTLIGGEGDDTLSGGADADRLEGGADEDTADYSQSTVGITVRLNGSAGLGGDAQGDRLIDIENITGSGFADSVTGNAADNVLTGAGGNDTLIGATGDDTLGGGIGADSLRGNGGDDLIEAGIGNDRANGDEGHDTIHGDAGNDRLLGGNEADLLWGDEGQDSLYGQSGADTLMGGADNDTLAGNRGADVLHGGLGNDLLLGNESRDTLNGNEGSDTLSGGAGIDVLSGGSGSDILNGGSGSDRLTGGGDADRFVFTNPGGIDRVTDFENGIDQLDFTAVGVDFGTISVASYGNGAGTRLQAAGHIVFLEGIDISLIDASDFV